jgi:hypothetical protein
MIRTLLITAGTVATLALTGCASSTPTDSTPTAVKSAPKAAPKSNAKGAAILRQARETAKGTSYAADLADVKTVKPDGQGLKLYTDLYSKDSNRADYGPASRAATPFLGLGYSPVRVYAANGELLITKGS